MLCEYLGKNSMKFQGMEHGFNYQQQQVNHRGHFVILKYMLIIVIIIKPSTRFILIMLISKLIFVSRGDWSKTGWFSFSSYISKKNHLISLTFCFYVFHIVMYPPYVLYILIMNYFPIKDF
jgi:hypothetical protein